MKSIRRLSPSTLCLLVACLGLLFPAWVGADAQANAPQDTTEFKIKLWEGNKIDESISAWERSGSVSEELWGGTVSITGETEVLQAGYEHTSEATIDKDGLNIEKKYAGEANLFKNKLEGGYRRETVVGDLNTKISVTDTLGVKTEAKGKLTIGPGGVEAEAGVEAFAGYKREIEGEFGWDMSKWLGVSVKGTVKAEGSVGVGGSAKGTFAVKDGKIKISGKLAKTIGIGGGVSSEVEIDVSPWVDSIGNRVADLRNWWNGPDFQATGIPGGGGGGGLIMPPTTLPGGSPGARGPPPGSPGGAGGGGVTLPAFR